MSNNELAQAKEIWMALLPRAPLPADDQWLLWLFRHGVNTVSEAVGQLAEKHHKLNGAMDADYQIRFASSVMNRLSRERKGTA
jgi:hypothetical protein